MTELLAIYTERLRATTYYVLSVRLFNNLKDETTKEYIGSSILAYSSSIEVAVNLEKSSRKTATVIF